MSVEEDSLINYFSEDRDTPALAHKTISWLTKIAESNNKSITEINYIFCSDDYLLKVNQDYLNHDYYTDIITFDNSDEDDDTLESDIFISIDRVEENAITNKASFQSELLRVMSHGLLHLCGFKDKSEEESQEMRKQENLCLSLWQDMNPA